MLFLTILVPFTSATPSHSPKELHFRDTAVQQRDVLPKGWSSLGCYTDNSSAPALTSGGYTYSTGMTVEFCVQTCQNLNHTYAGLENGQDCYCGNVLTPGTVSAPASDCSSKCVGNSGETCGGSGFLNLYWNGKPLQPQPSLVYGVPDADDWEVVGCYNDSINARALSVQVSVSGGSYQNTVENCIDTCVNQNYHGAGVEFAQECWCGNSIENGAVPIDMFNCRLACPGDSTQLCGGADAIILYFLDGI